MATEDHSTVYHCHDLRTFAVLGLSHPRDPFLAITKVSSMRHSVKSRLSRSFKSWARALRMCSKVPERIHSWKRRWQVWQGGCLSGMLCQGAPVRMTQRIALRMARSSLLGWPSPSDRLGGKGISGLTTAHYSSVRSIGSPPKLLRPF